MAKPGSGQGAEIVNEGIQSQRRKAKATDCRKRNVYDDNTRSDGSPKSYRGESNTMRKSLVALVLVYLLLMIFWVRGEDDWHLRTMIELGTPTLV